MISTNVIEELRREETTKRKAMPVLGQGTFIWHGKSLTLPIVKEGKRDITLLSPDATLVILNKRLVKVAPS